MAAPILYRESWAELPAERPVAQRHVAHPDLELAVYGPGAPGLKKSHHDDVPGDPHYAWSGKCAGPWALAFRHRALHADGRGEASVMLRTRQSGDHVLRVIAKPADGAWLVSDEGAGATADWSDSAFVLAALAWHELDVDAVAAGRRVVAPALARLDALGVADFRPGGDSGACSRLAAFEVRAIGIPRRSPACAAA